MKNTTTTPNPTRLATLMILGREFVLKPLDNGAQELIALDGGEITEAQWETYCAQMRARQKLLKIATEHAEADKRCNRDWLTDGCSCGACNIIRSEKTLNL